VPPLRSRQSAAVDDDRPEDDERVQVDDDTRNDLAWMRFHTPVGARGHSTTVAGYSRTLADFDFNGHFDTGFTQRSNAPFRLEKPKTDVMFSRRLEVEDMYARQELGWSLGAHTIDVGGELHRLRTRLNFARLGDTNPQAINGSSAQGGAGLPEFLDSRLNSTRAGAWVIDTWRAGPRARLEAGLRLDRTSITAHTTLSPRLAASFAVTPKLSARASFGRFTQSSGYEKMAQSDYILNFTADTAPSLRSERATLGSISLERTLGGGATVRVEAYYKRLADLLIGRLETEPERLARLAEYNFPSSLASSLPVDPIITTVPTNDGRRRHGDRAEARSRRAPHL
jgi:outer membrane receptor protein involved in Fe transport